MDLPGDWRTGNNDSVGDCRFPGHKGGCGESGEIIADGVKRES